MQRELSERLDTFARAAEDLLSAWMRFDEQGTAYELQEGYPKSLPSFDEVVTEIREWAEANSLTRSDRDDMVDYITDAVGKSLDRQGVEGVDEDLIREAVSGLMDAAAVAAFIPGAPPLQETLVEIENESDFVAFRNTRRLVPDLRLHVDGLDFLKPGHEAGFLYDDRLYIHAYPDGQFELVLHNSDFLSYDLAELERRLYEFAKEEGAWPPKVQDPQVAIRVVDEVERQERDGYAAWNAFEASPLIDALRVAFVRTLQEQDALYHFDDDALEIGNSPGGGPFVKRFTTFEAEALNEIRDALYGHPKKGGERLHGLAIDAQNAAF